jgi:uncharacterized phage protein gp47/JayE
MAFTRPTLPELIDRIQADFVSRLSLVGALLRRSVVYVLSRVWAGATHMLHGHLEFVSRQLFADTAEAEFLERIGGLFGVPRNSPAFAAGVVNVSGTDGTLIPAGTVLVRSDGVKYETEIDVTVASGSVTLDVLSISAGASGNCAGGTVLSFESPIAGVSSTGTVAVAGISLGADKEDIEDYRTRVMERMRSPPHGGAAADYVAWAKEVAGVTRAWVYPQELGAGTVTVRFCRDDDLDGPIPDSSEVTAVANYIAAKKPVTATLTVVAPVATPINFTLHIAPDTSDTRAAVQAELTDMLRRTAEPGAITYLSQLRTAIGNAAGITDYTLTAPAANVSHTAGQLATLGTITWT